MTRTEAVVAHSRRPGSSREAVEVGRPDTTAVPGAAACPELALAAGLAAACSPDTKAALRPRAWSARQASPAFPRFVRDRSDGDSISEVRTRPRVRALARSRETPVANLLELGPVSVPSLEDALKDKDVEIVFRAERLLLRLGRPVP